MDKKDNLTLYKENYKLVRSMLNYRLKTTYRKL